MDVFVARNGRNEVMEVKARVCSGRAMRIADLSMRRCMSMSRRMRRMCGVARSDHVK
jgi:hypothetical protein